MAKPKIDLNKAELFFIDQGYEVQSGDEEGFSVSKGNDSILVSKKEIRIYDGEHHKYGSFTKDTLSRYLDRLHDFEELLQTAYIRCRLEN